MRARISQYAAHPLRDPEPETLPLQPDAAPTRLDDTGLAPALLMDLAAKHLLLGGDLEFGELGTRLALHVGIVDELVTAMLEAGRVRVLAASDGRLRVALAPEGRVAASTALAHDAYIGPAPLALSHYERVVAANSVARQHITRREMDLAFGDIVVDERVLDGLGLGLNSARPLFVHGPAGAGKTFLCERLARVLRGATLVPYALALGDTVVAVYDPVLHLRLDTQARRCGGATVDPRLVACRRPALSSGAELERSMLELRRDPATGIVQAPMTLKANTGLYIVDDFGAQRIDIDSLMQRWSLPIDSRHDWLALGDDAPARVPFDVLLVLVSRRSPEALGGESLRRRIGHSVELGEVSRDTYLRLWRDASAALGLTGDDALACHALDALHGPHRIPPLSSHPAELLANMLDRARYADDGGALSTDLLHRAWTERFARTVHGARTAASAGTP